MRSILLTKQMRGHVVLVGLAPHGLGLRLDAGDAVEHGDGAVEHAQRALDLDGEVDVAGRVDDVDAVVVPEAGGGGRRDGDAALLLLDHPVHRGRALVDLTDLVGLAGVVEDALGRRGLARVDVGHDADVAGALEGDARQPSILSSRSRSCVGTGPIRRRRAPAIGSGGPAGAWHRSGACTPDPVRGLTSGSGRRPCSTRPSCACLRGASPRRRRRWMASSSSLARRSAIVFSRRWRRVADEPADGERVGPAGRTSTGTW